MGHENSVGASPAGLWGAGDRPRGGDGNRSLETGFHNYPRDLFHYCVGLDSLVLRRGSHIPEDLPDQVEEHLKRPSCCGVKLYPGYNRLWLTDPVYDPIYRLAERYDKPVAVHTGLTAYARAHLKYSHPLALDEAAADHPRTRFVMCHFGNPFLQEAAAVLAVAGRKKNDALLAIRSGAVKPQRRDFKGEPKGSWRMERTPD